MTRFHHTTDFEFAIEKSKPKIKIETAQQMIYALQLYLLVEWFADIVDGRYL